jgi:hypothetical protein
VTLTVNEADGVTDAVIAYLKADTVAGGVNTLVSGRIYQDVAPNETPVYPMVTVSVLAAPNLMTANREHVWQDVQILTTVTDRSQSYASVIAINSRLIARLDQYGDVTVSGVYIHRLRPVEVIPRPSEYVNGQRYQYRQLRWETEAEPA